MLPPLVCNSRDLLERVMCCGENPFLVLKGVQQVQPPSQKKLFPQVLRPEVRVDAGGQNHAQAAVGPQQAPEHLGEHLVGIEVGTALQPKGMFSVGVAGVLAAVLGPSLVSASPSLPRARVMSNGSATFLAQLPRALKRAL